MNLNEYYQTPHWQNTRKKRLEIDNYTCRTCGVKEPEYSLHVHHIRYNNFHEDVNNDLITLCKDCHEAVTSVIRARRYRGQEIAVQNHSSIIPERKDNYELEESEFQINLRSTTDHAQRRISEPAKPSSRPDEKAQWQAVKDSGRPGTTS